MMANAHFVPSPWKTNLFNSQKNRPNAVIMEHDRSSYAPKLFIPTFISVQTFQIRLSFLLGQFLGFNGKMCVTYVSFNGNVIININDFQQSFT